MFDTLVLSLPTRDSTLRMRVWRALKESGCAVLRDGVYLLPTERGDGAALEKLEKEIRLHGGFALRLQAAPKAPTEQSRLQALFDRTPQYADLIEEIAWVRGAVVPRYSAPSRRLKSSHASTSSPARRRSRRPLRSRT